MYYHPKKEDAQAVLNRLLEDPRVASGVVQMEPYNGWLAVVVPAYHDLSDLADVAEIQDGRKRPPPVDKVRPSRVSEAKPRAEGGGGGAAPVRGATAMVWTIADRITKELGRIDRAAIIAACVAEGINQATAGTQYSKWKKTQ